MWRWDSQKMYRNKKALYRFYALKSPPQCLSPATQFASHYDLYNRFDKHGWKRPVDKSKIIFRRQFPRIQAILFFQELWFPSFQQKDVWGQSKQFYNWALRHWCALKFYRRHYLPHLIQYRSPSPIKQNHFGPMDFLDLLPKFQSHWCLRFW